jgi:hypothetical protein
MVTFVTDGKHVLLDKIKNVIMVRGKQMRKKVHKLVATLIVLMAVSGIRILLGLLINNVPLWLTIVNAVFWGIVLGVLWVWLDD